VFSLGCSYWLACHAGIVFTQWSNNGFLAPPGQHVAPINVTFGTGEQTAAPCQISRLSGQKGESKAPKTVKILNSGHKFVCSIFTKFSAFVWVPFNFLVRSLSGDKQPSYKHFSSVWAFSYKFSIAPNGKTTIGSKKVGGGAKMAQTSSITMPSMVEIVDRVPAVDEKA